MGETSLKTKIKSLRRFFGFVLPHWRLILVAFIATWVYSLAGAGAILMLKPVVEGLAQRGETKGVESPSPTVGLPGGATSELEPAQQLREAGEGVKGWLVGLGPVRAVVAYVGPGPNQFKHIGYIVLLLVAPLWTATVLLENYASERVAWHVLADVRVALFEKLSSMSLSFFSGRRIGDLISRVTNDVATTQTTINMIFSDILVHPLRIAAFLVVALLVSWELTLFALAAVPLLALAISRLGGRIHKQGRKTLERLADITEALNQMFTGIRVVKAFGMESEENSEFRGTSHRQLARAFKLVRARAWALAVPHAIIAVLIGLALLAGSYLVAEEVIKPSDLACVAVALVAMISPMKRTVKCLNTISANMGALDRIFEMIDQDVDLQDVPDAAELTEVREEIRFRDVWFAYCGEDYVLRGIDFVVPVGTVCAVVGETGAGKSTMLDLIPRFYEPSRGSVEIDGLDVRLAKRKSLLKHVAIVAQHPFLFNRSIAENIRYGRRDATLEEVRAAARAARLDRFVESQPEGYDTVVGERGSRLSGGQRQCLTIARALLKDAPILILDEATSSLDSESERMVQNALQNLMKGRTTFVIAHRLSTVRYADMIVVLKGGRIAEQGTHEELLQRGGEYAKLHRLQFADAFVEMPDVTPQSPAPAPSKAENSEGNPT